MKVVLFNESFPPLIDGVSIVVQNYCKELKNMGDTPIAVVPQIKNQKDDFDFKVMRFGAHDFNFNIGYPVGNPINPKLIFDIIRQKPDILHSHSPFAAAMIARQVRQYKKIPYVITYHTRF
jgi:glycosyltransferase involved in cell wall biosynthesis